MDSHVGAPKSAPDPRPMDVGGPSEQVASPAVLPTHIFYGTGFVIHGLGMHFNNGTRTGLVLENSKSPVDLHDEFRMPHRAHHTSVLQRGEIPTSFTGFRSRMGFLAHQIEFSTTYNQRPYRTLPVIAGSDQDSRGDMFSYQAPPGFYIKDIWWLSGRPSQVYLAVIPSLVPGHEATYTDHGWTPLQAVEARTERT